jgi:hypothetical protein
MPIPLPNLDDRRFDDLVEEARALIPHIYPQWTDHNPSDPGIILMEMLAWLTETVLYRLDQIAEPNYRVFLQLLNGPENPVPAGDLEQAIRVTVLSLRQRYRAVTAEDYEYLVLQVWPDTAAAATVNEPVQRVLCMPQRNLEGEGEERTRSAPGHVSLVVVPAGAAPQPSLGLRDGLWRFLDERRLLTVRHHVVGPDYLKVEISGSLYLEQDATADTVRAVAVAALRAYFDPLTGGGQGKGWPFGRGVYLSEIHQILDDIPGVDFADAIGLTAMDRPERVLYDNAGEPIGLGLEPNELVQLQTSDFTLLEPTGVTWQALD